MPALAILLTLAAQNGPTMRDVRVSVVGMVPLVPGQPEPAVLEFKLENRTRKTVTAWEVRVVESVRTGGLFAATGELADGLMTYSGLAPSGKYSAVMPPGAFTHGFVSVPDDLREGVGNLRAVLVCAIFDDRTWIGDREAAGRVFAFRAADKEATEYIAASLRAGLDAGAVGGDAVRVALERLEAMREDEFAYKSHKNNMLGNLQRLLGRRATLTPAQVEANLRAVLRRTEQQWAAADEHSRPAPR